MKMNDIPKKGARFRVVNPPKSLPLLDGTSRGAFQKDEVVEFDFYTYNSYDGFPMFFFKPRADGSEVVWLGNYQDTAESMLSQWEQYFQILP